MPKKQHAKRRLLAVGSIMVGLLLISACSSGTKSDSASDALDPNADLKRALNINLIPHTFLLNGTKEIVWQHSSYTEGDELKLIQRVKDLNAGIEVKD